MRRKRAGRADAGVVTGEQARPWRCGNAEYRGCSVNQGTSWHVLAMAGPATTVALACRHWTAEVAIAAVRTVHCFWTRTCKPCCVESECERETVTPSLHSPSVPFHQPPSPLALWLINARHSHTYYTRFRLQFTNCNCACFYAYAWPAGILATSSRIQSRIGYNFFQFYFLS